jgi:hypothetical protein
MEQFDNNINEDAINNSKYKNIGFQYAQDSQANPEIITSGLAKVLAIFREDSIFRTKQRIEKLKADIVSLKNQETDDTAILKSAQLIIYAKEAGIKLIERQREEIKDRKSDTAESINVGLQIFGLVILFLFLYVFYASVGYSILNEAKDISSSILNPDAFVEAARKGGSTIAIVYFIPGLILVFGILIHFFLGKIRNEKEEKTKFWIVLLIVFVLFAFCFDAIAGYKISQNVYNANFDAGRIAEQWHFSLVFNDINFYLILILGFVAYLAWGILLHALISNPVFDINDQIKRFDGKIAREKEELFEIKQKFNTIESNLDKLKRTITEKEQILHNYENGGTYYDIQKFRGIIGIFMEGYSSYVIPYCNNEEKAKEIMNAAKHEQTEWENNIIQDLEMGS